MVKICSWNINGIRSFFKPIKHQLDKLNCDIVCFQETKANGQLPSEFCFVDGYNSYFSICASKPGYSGVCVFCRDPLKPYCVIGGLNVPPLQKSLSEFDDEGRAIILKFKLSHSSKDLSVFSIYCPRVEPGNKERSDYRRKFLHRLQSCIYSLILEGSYVIVAGDLNICHNPIDHCCLEEYKISDGESRDWLRNMLTYHSGEANNGQKMTHLYDVFRLAHPNRSNAFSCWKSSTGARKTNYGTRIDYILCCNQLVSKYDSEDLFGISDLMVDVEGSDHCPVWAQIPISVDEFLAESPGDSLHPLCTAFWPQCLRRQISISNFLKPYTTSEVAIDVDSQKRRTAITSCQAVKKPKQTKLSFAFEKNNLFDNENSDLSKTTEILTPAQSCPAVDVEERTIANSTALQWSKIFRPSVVVVPKCSGHCELCVRRKVKRASKNRGRDFWTCARPEGAPGSPEARCSTFIWSDNI